MVKKGKNFSGKVTPLFDSMLVQQTEDEGDASERPLCSTTHTLSSSPNCGDKTSYTSLDPFPDLHLLLILLILFQRVLVGIMEVTAQAKEIRDLKAHVKKLKKGVFEPYVHKDPAFDDLDDFVDVDDTFGLLWTDWGCSKKRGENGMSLGDDVTIVQSPYLMSQKQRRSSRKKEKGVEIRNVEETMRPKPTSQDANIDLRPIPKD
ncbi:hypothetical protein Tco_0590133 [Tanacetum coccineum]